MEHPRDTPRESPRPGGPTRGPTVPRLLERALGRLIPPDQKDAALGDAAEEFARRAAKRGAPAARRWYAGQVARSVLPALQHDAMCAAAGIRRTTAKREVEVMRGWIDDFALAARAMCKRPGFSATVLVTLALGVGANTALFGVFRAVFLDPVALPDSGELVVVMEQGELCCGPASGPDFVDWRDRNRVFEHIAVLRPGSFTLTSLSEPQRVSGVAVVSSAFDVVGVEPLLGRVLLPDDQVSPSVVVLSHELWRTALGESADVVGTSLDIDGSPFTIVGVMPPGFDIPSPWSQLLSHKLYLPFENAQLETPRGQHGFPVIARLADGVTKEEAQADMDRIMRELAAEYPATNGGRTSKVFTLHEYLFGDAGRQLGLILGAAGLVLLVACGNVAGLQLARAAGRESELAVRAALGASRSALVRLLFSESLLLALLGGLGGMLLSLLMVEGLKSMLPPTLPRLDGVRVDGAAMGFALGASALTALIFGMLPALLASRRDLASSVKEGGYGTRSPAKERARNAFIVGQIALGLVLANGAALLVRSYASLRSQDFGFEVGVVTLFLNPAGPRYADNQSYVTFYNDVIERVRALPGVEGVGTVTRLPLAGGSNGSVWVEGTPPRRNEEEGPLVEVTSVMGDYFAAMQIPLLRGRLLLSEDSVSSAVGVVVNQRLVDLAWPNTDPIGKRFSFFDNPPQWLTVVGVVGDVPQWGPDEPVQAQAYFPFTRGWDSSAYLAVRSSGESLDLVPSIRQAILAVDPAQPATDVRTMSERVDRTFAQRRFYTTLIALFAAAALFLAAAGIYGTVSYFVTRRTRELAIRVALGARDTGIVRLVVHRAVRLAIAGVLLGLVGVWASTRAFATLVYGVRPIDPLTLISGCILLGLVAVGAAALPARRAVRVPPLLALRAE
jgi:putative ABC transport system permease protein